MLKGNYHGQKVVCFVCIIWKIPTSYEDLKKKRASKACLERILEHFNFLKWRHSGWTLGKQAPFAYVFYIKVELLNIRVLSQKWKLKAENLHPVEKKVAESESEVRFW